MDGVDWIYMCTPTPNCPQKSSTLLHESSSFIQLIDRKLEKAEGMQRGKRAFQSSPTEDVMLDVSKLLFSHYKCSTCKCQKGVKR